MKNIRLGQKITLLLYLIVSFLIYSLVVNLMKEQRPDLVNIQMNLNIIYFTLMYSAFIVSVYSCTKKFFNILKWNSIKKSIIDKSKTRNIEDFSVNKIEDYMTVNQKYSISFKLNDELYIRELLNVDDSCICLYMKLISIENLKALCKTTDLDIITENLTNIFNDFVRIGDSVYLIETLSCTK